MSRRTEMLGSTIQRELAEMILRDLNDPRLSGFPSITRVKVSPDLSIADVYVTIMGTPGQQTAALNALALIRKQIGSLDRVSRVVRLGVYVAATPEFTEHPKVADAASELFRDLFGADAVSTRLVFGVTSLPLGSPIELEVILEVNP